MCDRMSFSSLFFLLSFVKNETQSKLSAWENWGIELVFIRRAPFFSKRAPNVTDLALVFSLELRALSQLIVALEKRGGADGRQVTLTGRSDALYCVYYGAQRHMVQYED